MRLTGMIREADNHNEAVAELKTASPTGAKLAPILARLLKLKTKSQYQSAAVAIGAANKAIEWAANLLKAAEQVVSARWRQATRHPSAELWRTG